ncbi:MAG: mannosyltransferase family protein [Pseudonocardiaceae bacterium]
MPHRVSRIPAFLAALTPAFVYLGARSVGLLIVFVMARVNSRSPLDVLTSWDAAWLLSIANNGYSGVTPDHVDSFGHHTPTTALAFFPGYPYFVRLLSSMGLNTVAVAFTVSLAAGIACAYGLVRLTGAMGLDQPGLDQRAGLVLIALFASAPLSIVLSMPYTEALFCALAVWTLVGLLTDRWVLAAGLCILAGLVRPTGVVLAIVVCVAAARRIFTSTATARVWIALLTAPLGIVGYLSYVAVRTGRLDGWLYLQHEGWGSSYDLGRETVRDSGAIVAHSGDAMLVITVAVVLGYLVLAVMAVRDRLSWPVVAYGIGATLMAVQSSVIMNSKARLLLVAFTLLIPVATRIARKNTTTVVTTTAAYTLAGSWFSAYSLIVWKYAI